MRGKEQQAARLRALKEGCWLII